MDDWLWGYFCGVCVGAGLELIGLAVLGVFR